MQGQHLPQLTGLLMAPQQLPQLPCSPARQSSGGTTPLPPRCPAELKAVPRALLPVEIQLMSAQAPVPTRAKQHAKGLADGAPLKAQPERSRAAVPTYKRVLCLEGRSQDVALVKATAAGPPDRALIQRSNREQICCLESGQPLSRQEQSETGSHTCPDPSRGNAPPALHLREAINHLTWRLAVTARAEIKAPPSSAGHVRARSRCPQTNASACPSAWSTGPPPSQAASPSAHRQAAPASDPLQKSPGPSTCWGQPGSCLQRNAPALRKCGHGANPQLRQGRGTPRTGTTRAPSLRPQPHEATELRGRREGEESSGLIRSGPQSREDARASSRPPAARRSFPWGRDEETLVVSQLSSWMGPGSLTQHSAADLGLGQGAGGSKEAWSKSCRRQLTKNGKRPAPRCQAPQPRPFITR
ncbi:serine/arginine repetitive matrix protein 1-like [Alligator sinensis]|uniref:Serine/arginine repetitive matrix protein 1-like n=1 Tax=Alligator sinensis TaxID=38654 RepID=A0A3Q0FTW0_ALLSI|nr:serine/arginine repetitive matrix protein 1-like [Alligator sinensis]XP_025050770.1 serine/arginine repetitive matrix protein 1-like [Alligator sinensis]